MNGVAAHNYDDARTIRFANRLAQLTDEQLVIVAELISAAEKGATPAQLEELFSLRTGKAISNEIPQIAAS